MATDAVPVFRHQLVNTVGQVLQAWDVVQPVGGPSPPGESSQGSQPFSPTQYLAVIGAHNLDFTSRLKLLTFGGQAQLLARPWVLLWQPPNPIGPDQSFAQPARSSAKGARVVVKHPGSGWGLERESFLGFFCHGRGKKLHYGQRHDRVPGVPGVLCRKTGACPTGSFPRPLDVTNVPRLRGQAITKPAMLGLVHLPPKSS